MKTVVSFLAALALALGMTTFVPSANAAPAYPGTVRTTTQSSVQGSVKPDRNVPLKYRVKANGNAQPVGQVKIEVFKRGKRGKLFLVRTAFRDVSSNRRQSTELEGFPLGTYFVQVSFKPNEGTVFKASNDKLRKFKVKRQLR